MDGKERAMMEGDQRREEDDGGCLLYLRHANDFYCFVHNHCLTLLKSILPDLDAN